MQTTNVIFLSTFSLLVVEAADRPGLLVDLVKIITDINITVQSGEFDTEVNEDQTVLIFLSFTAYYRLRNFPSLNTGLVGKSKVPCQLQG